MRGDVIISELMYNPQGTDLDTTVTPNISREWAEIYNTSNSAVDISGWQFGDAQDNDWASAFPAGTSIGAHQALVVTGDAVSFDKEWGTGINRIQVSNFRFLPIQRRQRTKTLQFAIRRISSWTIFGMGVMPLGHGLMDRMAKVLL